MLIICALLERVCRRGGKEVDTDQDARMPASLWGKYEIDLVKNFLSPALVLNKYVERWLAWHDYMGTPNAMSQVHEAVATKNTSWTEGRPTIGPEYQTILTRFKFGSDRRIFHGRDRYIDAEEERSMASTRTCGHVPS
jgi:hypothetical protein